MPSGNEYLYLLLTKKLGDPNFLLNDWTLSQPWYTHLMFNFVVAPFTSLLSLEAVGWIGRITCWSITFVALFKLGQHFLIPRWMITLSILLWILQGQSIVGGEWVIGGFEAKCVAYVLLLFALNGLIMDKVTVPSILLGLSFSFHPGVGLWAGVALVFLLVILQRPVKQLVTIISFTSLFALPGLVPLLYTLHGTAAGSVEDWKYFVLVRAPHHLDPFSWPKRDVALLYILLLFNWLHFRRNQDNRALRLLISFELALGAIFSAGLILRFAESYQLLKYGPFRLFPVFVLLLFFFHLMSGFCAYSSVKLGTGVAMVGLLALLGLGNPIGQFMDQASENYSLWTKADDLQKAYKWIAENTPSGSVVISPPWRRDSWYLSQRAQVAIWQHPPYDQLDIWRARIVAMIGDDWLQAPKEDWPLEMERYYNNLSEKKVQSIVKNYGGDYLLSKKEYTYPLLYDSGTYKVYSLKESHTAPYS